MPVVHALASIIASLFRALLRALAFALSPSACAACDGDAHAPLCAACACTLAPPRLPEEEALEGVAIVAVAAFGGALAVAIRRLKYNDRPDLAQPLGRLLRAVVRDARLSADLIVPVPLHPRRLAERGYNQAALLARHVAAELRAPMVARGLLRLRDTPQQARLGRVGRLANVAAAFRVRAPVRGRSIVLVDDVATTGATLLACRAALLDAGAASVTCLVLAIAGPHRPRPGVPHVRSGAPERSGSKRDDRVITTRTSGGRV